MKFIWLCRGSYRAAISTASCSDPTRLLEKLSLVSSDCDGDERDTGEQSLVMVEIAEGDSYVEMVMVLAAVVRAAVVKASVAMAAVVMAAVVELRLVAAVEEVRDAPKSML